MPRKKPDLCRYRGCKEIAERDRETFQGMCEEHGSDGEKTELEVEEELESFFEAE